MLKDWSFTEKYRRGLSLVLESYGEIYGSTLKTILEFVQRFV